MENYINMNDSFGNKHSVSSTKSFQTYEESISSLKQQLFNHQKALQTAESIIEQYQQENQRLITQINSANEAKLRAQQKYQVLQDIFIKLDKAKKNQLTKQTKKSQEKHLIEIKNLNAKYQQQITGLNQKIYFLELQIQKYQAKQKKYKNFLWTFEQKSMAKELLETRGQLNKKLSIAKRQQGQNSDDSLQKIWMKTQVKIQQNPQAQINKTVNSFKQHQTIPSIQVETGQILAKSHLIIDRSSLGKKQTRTQSKNSEYKDKWNSFQRKPTRLSQVRVNTTEDYYSQKLQMIKATQKPKHLFIYDTNFDHLKDFR